MSNNFNIISKYICNTSESHRINYTLLAEYCKELRLKEKETIKDACVKVGVTRQTYSKLENLHIYDFLLVVRILENYNEELTILRK